MDKIQDINYITYVDGVPKLYKAQQILGLSTENKPTLLADEVGARFLCSDNGDEYVWTGATWIQIGKSILDAIGNLAELDTTEKDEIVGALNEVRSLLGDLADLDTTEQGTLVGAINEVLAAIPA